MNPRRGEVFVANLYGEEVPVVVVSRDSANANRIIVIVPAVPRELLVVIDYGLVVVPQGILGIAGEWVFLCANVRSLRLDQLTSSAGTLPPRLMSKIDSALRGVLNLN
jgi:mRNA-degrading endonuclease toxin of MazEF toxin-antitoxin module